MEVHDPIDMLTSNSPCPGAVAEKADKMKQQFREALLHANVRAFLQMLRYGEGTSWPEGYKVLFGGELFSSFDDHPRVKVTKKLGGSMVTSSAAGAYQILMKTWDGLVRKYGFEDFTPDSQDLAAVALIYGRKALDDVIAGRFETAVRKCNREWASLPGSPYGQPTVTMGKVRELYVKHGGKFDTVVVMPEGPPTESPAPAAVSFWKLLLDSLKRFFQKGGEGQ